MFIVEKDFVHNGLRCVVIMGEMGHRCGYVGVDKNNSLFHQSYKDEITLSEEEKKSLMNGPVGKRGMIDLVCFDGKTITPSLYFDVHGGITFSENDPIYPVPSDLWWFGYDCAHNGDRSDYTQMMDKRTCANCGAEAIHIKCEHCGTPSPKYEELKRFGTMMGGVIRDLDYCTEECKHLADQLVKFQKENP